MILNAAEKFEQGRYLHAIYSCNLKKEDILATTAFVKEYRAKLSQEHFALAKFSITFNQEYATANNNCFELAENLFNRIRSTISGSKKIYKRFCRTVRKQTPYVHTKCPSVFKRSELVNQYLTGQLFGLDSYDQCVSLLYQELEGFFIELVNCLALCRLMITDERNIRNTPERCMKIYQDCYDQMVSNSEMMVRAFRANNMKLDDEIYERRMNSTSLQDFICSGFHKFAPAQFQKYVVASELAKGTNNGLTDSEVKLFGADSIERVKKIRIVIEHFDEIEIDAHKGKHKDKHSAYCVASFMQWCGIGNGDKKEKMFVEEYFNQTYEGKFPPIGVSSVNTAKNKIVTETVKDFDNDEFHDKIEEIVKRSAKKERAEMKLAVSF